MALDINKYTLRNEFSKSRVIRKKDNYTILSFYKDERLCSSIRIYDLNYRQEDVEEVKNIFNSIFKNVVLVTLQNITKPSSKLYKQLGFIDIYRIPGQYTSSYGSSKDNVQNCLSFMIRSSKKLDISLKTSLDLIKKYSNKELETKETKVIKKSKLIEQVLNLPKLTEYFCVNPTNTLTKHKIYKSPICIKNKLIIKNDFNKRIVVNKDRFEEVVI